MYEGGRQGTQNQSKTEETLTIDTEGTLDNIWGLSLCGEDGIGVVVRAEDTWKVKYRIESAKEIILHNALWDFDILQKLGLDISWNQISDSMLMAYLLPWLPRALKPLMYKLTGLEQESYETTIGPADKQVARSYLEKIIGARPCPKCLGKGEVDEPYKRNPEKFKRVKCPSCAGDGTGWPQPAPRLLFDNTMSGRVYKPRSLGRTVRAALERDTDLRSCWESVDSEIRNVVEGELGRMSEASLDDIPLEKAVHYSGMDAVGTRAVSIELKKMLKEHQLERVYEIDKSILPIIHRMHNNGILIDREYFAKLGEDFGHQQMGIMDKLSGIAGGNLNPGSPVQVAALFYGKLRLKAPRGSRSTDDKTMQALKIKYSKQENVVECIDLINDYRELGKLIGTYVEPLPLAADENDRVHTQFLLHVTTSGRLSSRNPNLQNQPTRTDRGKLIRKGFIAKPGCSLVSVDLDQIELRVTAHLSEDENMIDVFVNSRDIHRSTASLIYGKPESEITIQERLLSKTMNFLILYGGGPSKLNKELSLMGINTSIDECVGYINGWFKAYPSIRQYMDRCYEQAEKLGYVECLFGRRRYLPGVHSTIEKIREESKRWATNHPAQATAAAVLKLWMADVDRNVLPQIQGYCEPLLTVHDEIIFEVEQGLEQQLIDLTVKSANNIVDFLVPIGAKGAYAQDWGGLK